MSVTDSPVFLRTCSVISSTHRITPSSRLRQVAVFGTLLSSRIRSTVQPPMSARRTEGSSRTHSGWSASTEYPVGTVLHPESGSHSFHPRTGNAKAALSETDIPGNFFSPCQNLPVGGRLPEPHLFSSLPGGSGSPVQWLPLSKDNNCHWRFCFLPASAAQFHTHKISHCTAGHSAWCTARNRIRSALSGSTRGEF